MKSATTFKHSAAAVIRELEAALDKGNAHAAFGDATKDLPEALRGTVPAGLPYSIWQLVEHIRIAQSDILEFSRNAKHVSPEWPEGYWPKEKEPPHRGDWQESLDRIAADRKAFIALLHRAGEAVFAPLPHGQGQSLFKEAILLIDHNSYHTGEIIVARRLLKEWKQ